MEFTSGMDLDEPEDILFDAIECSSLNVAPQKADIDLEPVTCSMMMESFQTEELSPIACFSLFSSERSTASARSDRDIEASPRLIHKVSHLEFAADDDHLSAQETPPYGSWRSVKTNASEPKEISLHPPIVMEEPFQRSASAPTVLGLTAVSSRLAADFSRRSSSASETKFIKLTQKRGSVFVGASCTIGAPGCQRREHADQDRPPRATSGEWRAGGGNNGRRGEQRWSLALQPITSADAALIHAFRAEALTVASAIVPFPAADSTVIKSWRRSRLRVD
eukprot:1916138-Rhodomonas_salina.1